ncbi:G5 and 3D domain-containing protein [Virgibacillus ndiopensis]|uniref:G5 and 3D domain-containing protein n=1 Tax=Virgibacillus ndiopensis TaxID=2004408 RepID=UPI000C083E1F|nr:G5 and 3D domain-containing protein [Virgibacillus ndiopensis]
MKIISKLLPASKKKLVISSIGVLALVVFSSLLLFEATKAEVDLTENGEKRTVKTHANTVGELLADLGIDVGKHDALSVNVDAKIEDGMKLNYEKAKQVIVSIDGKEKEYFTTLDTVGDFLADNKLSFSEHDEVSQERDDAIKDGLKVSVSLGFKVAINDGGNERKVWANGGTVKELIHKNNITLNELDKIKPAKDEKVTKDTKVKIVRVEKVTDVVEETVAFKTETKKDASLVKGKEKVLDEGKKGTVVKEYEVVMENGKEVSRELISEKVKEESENRVVAIGTKQPEPVVEQVSRSNDSNSKVLYMTATAFTADCGGCSGHTATGVDLQANPNAKVVAVDPSVIPLGSKVWVEGYGYAIAADTGGFSGNHIDVHVPTKADAYSFGRKNVKVKIIE